MPGCLQLMPGTDAFHSSVLATMTTEHYSSKQQALAW